MHPALVCTSLASRCDRASLSPENLAGYVLLPTVAPTFTHAGALALKEQVEEIVERALSKRPRPAGDSGVTTGHVSVSVMGADEVQLWDVLVRKKAVGSNHNVLSYISFAVE